MAIVFSCPCGKDFNAEDELAGKRARCPQCECEFRIPNRSTFGPIEPTTSVVQPAAKPSKVPPVMPIQFSDDVIQRMEDAGRMEAASESRAVWRDPIILYGAGIPILFLLIFLGYVAGASSAKTPSPMGVQNLASEPSAKPRIVAQAPPPQVSVVTSKQDSRKSVTVYVSYTGSKFHTDRCNKLVGERVSITLFQADEKYEPCGDCWPPRVLARGDSAPMALTSSSGTSAPAISSSSSVAATTPRAAPNHETPYRTESAYPGTAPTGIPLHVGPRGGIYHYSKNGNKVYERKRK
jgi:hypothetical protein